MEDVRRPLRQRRFGEAPLRQQFEAGRDLNESEDVDLLIVALRAARFGCRTAELLEKPDEAVCLFFCASSSLGNTWDNRQLGNSIDGRALSQICRGRARGL